VIVRTLVAALGLAVAGSLGAQAPQARAPATPGAKAVPAKKAADSGFKLVLEPCAMELLKATSAKLAAAKSMSFTATVGYEYPSKLGPPLVYTTRYDVAMQRPDKLRVLIPGDGPASEVYYDGKSIVAYAPVENLAAVVDAPPTIDAALAAAFRTAQIYFPFGDLLAADPYKALTDGAILAFCIGPSSVGDVRTQMLAWANDDTFLQMWIGADDQLPRRIRATFRADPLSLRHEMTLSNWQLDVPFPPDAFASANAQTAGRMAFAAPAPPPKGAKQLAAGKSPPANAVKAN
jgi:hypothetical protein